MGAMETKILLCLVLTFTGSLGLLSPETGHQMDSNDKNHGDIVKITKFVRDSLALDVRTNREFAEENNNKTEVIAKAIIQHVNELNNMTTNKLEETLRKLQTAIEKNMELIVDQTAENHNALETRSKNNEEKILKETEAHFNVLQTKIKARLAQHEKMLGTHVTICAQKHQSHISGKISYEHTFIESITIGGEPRAPSKVLDVSRGEFTAPVSGTYEISFTAIVDTLRDTTYELAPAKFMFAKAQKLGAFNLLDYTTLTASAGQRGGDKVPASRSVLLDLQKDDRVAVYQVKARAETTYRLTFCAHLIRPKAPTAPWTPLTSMAAPDLKVESTYTEPKQDSFTLGDLRTSLPDPEVSMPTATPLDFPKTNFFNKISGPTDTGSLSTDPITEDDPNIL